MTDFNTIKPEHEAIHEALKNWARWCLSGSRGGSHVHPMFRGYRPYLHPETVPVTPIDQLGAIETQKAFVRLPVKHRFAISWAYVHPWVSQGKVQRGLEVTRAGLADLVTDGRQMMRNLA